MADQLLIEEREIDGLRLEHRRSAFPNLGPYWRAVRPRSLHPSAGYGNTAAAAVEHMNRLHGVRA